MPVKPAEGSSPRFAELLRDFRLVAGLTQEELAERAGLSQRGVSDLERGTRRNPYPATIRRLAGAMRLAAEDQATLETAAERPRRDLRQPHLLTATNRTRGILDTSTVILLPRSSDPTLLPDQPLITAATLAELSVPLIDQERLLVKPICSKPRLTLTRSPSTTLQPGHRASSLLAAAKLSPNERRTRSSPSSPSPGKLR